ncbi:hypothetical protein G6F43_011845 [Rhizopus delemar]|nr:hypothetical protein G6F43_011845 [Rhizopus delemar]
MSNIYQIPRYKRGQNPKDWLNYFNAGCKILQVKEEDKLDLVPGYLRGTAAATWFFDHHFSNWEHFEQEFEDRFTTRKKHSTKAIITKILNIKKGSRETIREYNDRFDHLVGSLTKKSSTTKIADEELKDAYIAGIHPSDLRRFVRRQKPSTLKEAKAISKEEEDNWEDSDSTSSESDDSSDECSDYGETDDSDDEDYDAKKRLKKLNEMKTTDNQSNPRKSAKTTKKAKNKSKESKNEDTKSKDSMEEVTSLMKNLTLLIQTQATNNQSYLNQQTNRGNVPPPKLCYNCQGEGHVAMNCRPCKYCKGSEGDHPFWECKLNPKKAMNQSQTAQNSASSYLVLSENQPRGIGNMKDSSKQGNFEAYAAEKRMFSGSDWDVRVTRSGKKAKVHDTIPKDYRRAAPVSQTRHVETNEAVKSPKAVVPIKTEANVLPGESIDVKDLTKAKVFTVSIEQLSKSIKGFKTQLNKELRTPQKNPRRIKMQKDNKITAFYNNGMHNNLSKVRYYVEDPKQRRGAPRVTTIVSGLVEVPAVLDQGSHGTIISVRLCDALGIDLSKARPSKTRHTLADGSVASALKDLDELMVQVQGVPVVIPHVSVLQHPSYDLLLGEDALDVLEIVTDHKRKHWTIRTDNGIEPLDIHWDHTNYIHMLEVDNNYSGDDESDMEGYSSYGGSNEECQYEWNSGYHGSYLMIPLMPVDDESSSNDDLQADTLVENFLNENGQTLGSSEEEIIEAVEQSVRNSDISEEQKEVLRKSLLSFIDVFGLDYKDLKQTNILKFTIDTGSEKPIYRKPNRFMSHSELDSLKLEVEEMIANCQLIPTPGGASSGWAFPVLYVKKKSGEKRLCVQFQDLNAITVQDAWPLPHITDLLESYQGSKIFSTLDLLKGFNQIAVDDDTIPKLTIQVLRCSVE